MQKTTMQRQIKVKKSDLPFSCPPPNAPKWNMHPRVFIPLSPSKPQHSCPYCGATYVLEGEEEGEQSAEKGS